MWCLCALEISIDCDVVSGEKTTKHLLVCHFPRHPSSPPSFQISNKHILVNSFIHCQTSDLFFYSRDMVDSRRSSSAPSSWMRGQACGWAKSLWLTVSSSVAYPNSACTLVLTRWTKTDKGWWNWFVSLTLTTCTSIIAASVLYSECFLPYATRGSFFHQVLV